MVAVPRIEYCEGAGGGWALLDNTVSDLWLLCSANWYFFCLLPSEDFWYWLSLLIAVPHDYSLFSSLFWPHCICNETSQLSFWDKLICGYFQIFFHQSFHCLFLFLQGFWALGFTPTFLTSPPSITAGASRWKPAGKGFWVMHCLGTGRPWWPQRMENGSQARPCRK